MLLAAAVVVRALALLQIHRVMQVKMEDHPLLIENRQVHSLVLAVTVFPVRELLVEVEVVLEAVTRIPQLILSQVSDEDLVARAMTNDIR